MPKEKMTSWLTAQEGRHGGHGDRIRRVLLGDRVVVEIRAVRRGGEPTVGIRTTVIGRKEEDPVPRSCEGIHARMKYGVDLKSLSRSSATLGEV